MIRKINSDIFSSSRFLLVLIVMVVACRFHIRSVAIVAGILLLVGIVLSEWQYFTS